jgi:hypothetical protein
VNEVAGFLLFVPFNHGNEEGRLVRGELKGMLETIVIVMMIVLILITLIVL